MELMEQPPTDIRVFLDFRQSPLVSAAQWIGQSHRIGNLLDLSGYLVVLPTARGSQRFLQLIVEFSTQEKLNLIPPILTTIGDFPEYLYDAAQPLTSDLCQLLAWSKALQQSPPWEIEELFGKIGHLTAEQWQPHAQMISELHRRLASEVWSFRTVAREFKKLHKSSLEVKRWEALEAIQGRYYEILNEVGLWDKQAARSVAIRRKLCRANHQIILIGVADLNRATRSMLDLIRDHVRVLVAAPETLRDRFEEFGGLMTGNWLDAEIRFPCERIRVVDRFEDQAFAVSWCLSQLDGQFAADQITIGIPDADVEPQVERSLNAIGVAHRNLKGTPVKDTGPIQLMVAVLEYLEQQDYPTYAALVRHPDMFDWLAIQLKNRHWLSDLDDYQNQGLPDRIEIAARQPFGEFDESRRHSGGVKTLNAVHLTLSRLLKQLVGKPKSITSWTKPWISVLQKIYGNRLLDKNDLADQQTIAACHELLAALNDLQRIPEGWKLEVTAAAAIRMAIDAVVHRTVISPPVPDAIELAGWLDLTLDDAQVMIVTGMNDEHIPASENGHPFLPNAICKELGILDNDRRYARDAYALTVITGVREHFWLITGRRDLQGEPLKPSRLLFADSSEVVAQRARAFFEYKGESEPQFWLADPDLAPKAQQFSIPRPTTGKPLDTLRVTAFREYLKCPYRFFLGSVLQLDSCDDSLQELDGGAFGTLLHAVMEDFGKSDFKDCADENQLLTVFNQRLDFQAQQNYPGSRLPAVRIQIEQLRMRLHRLAPLQAQWASQGWRIVSVEERNNHTLNVDGLPFEIRGTIDRVDVNDSTGQVAIWDYKTSDTGDSPNAVHRNKTGWKDLQLPLYRHLAKEISALAGLDLSRGQLGYILLPRELDKTSFSAANWTDGELAEADELMRSIIRNIRAEKFWPPASRAPKYSEKFAAICQDAVFEKYSIELDAQTAKVSP